MLVKGGRRWWWVDDGCPEPWFSRLLQDPSKSPSGVWSCFRVGCCWWWALQRTDPKPRNDSQRPSPPNLLHSVASATPRQHKPPRTMPQSISPHTLPLSVPFLGVVSTWAPCSLPLCPRSWLPQNRTHPSADSYHFDSRDKYGNAATSPPPTGDHLVCN